MHAWAWFGEDLACEELERRGYAVIDAALPHQVTASSTSSRAHGEYLVFVEVKARQDGSFGDPEEAVTLQKQQRMVWMATDYLARHQLETSPCRFDVVGDQHRHATPPRVDRVHSAGRVSVPGW